MNLSQSLDMFFHMLGVGVERDTVQSYSCIGMYVHIRDGQGK